MGQAFGQELGSVVCCSKRLETEGSHAGAGKGASASSWHAERRVQHHSHNQRSAHGLAVGANGRSVQKTSSAVLQERLCAEAKDAPVFEVNDGCATPMSEDSGSASGIPEALGGWVPLAEAKQAPPVGVGTAGVGPNSTPCSHVPDESPAEQKQRPKSALSGGLQSALSGGKASKAVTFDEEPQKGSSMNLFVADDEEQIDSCQSSSQRDAFEKNAGQLESTDEISLADEGENSTQCQKVTFTDEVQRSSVSTAHDAVDRKSLSGWWGESEIRKSVKLVKDLDASESNEDKTYLNDSGNSPNSSQYLTRGRKSQVVRKSLSDWYFDGKARPSSRTDDTVFFDLQDEDAEWYDAPPAAQQS